MRKDELSDNEQTLLSQACERLSFLIIGTGRCGTGYAAGLVTACGFPTGHEEVFGPSGPGYVPRGMVGDSSWLAVPYLEAQPGPKIVHLVRDPLRVVCSFVGIRFFSSPAHGMWQAFAFKHVPQLLPGDDLGSAIRWTVEWNDRCEKLLGKNKNQRVRVEDLSSTDEVKRLANLSGGEISTDQAVSAKQLVPNDYNARPREDLTWANIPNDKWGNRLRDLANRYGYSKS